MPGPPPKPPGELRRRNKGPSTVQLPAEGRSGETPKWPLSRPTKAETSVWAQVWSTPQSVQWERMGWIRTVARYVRISVDAEKRDAAVSLSAEARQLEDRLGLTPMSMLRLRWEIVADEVAEKRETAPVVERRLKAVDPNTGTG